MPYESLLVGACDGIPQSDGIVPNECTTPASERSPIRTERYAQNKLRMPFESVLVDAIERIPEADGTVPAPTGERPPVRTER